MTITLILIASISIAFGIGSFVLNSKEKKAIKEKLEKTENEKNKVENVINKYSEEQKANEELYKRATSGNTNDSASASVELLHKLSQKGKKRNSSE